MQVFGPVSKTNLRWLSHLGTEPDVFQRYGYYIEKGIDSDMLAPPPDTQMENIMKLIPNPLLEATHLQSLLTDTKEEILYDYEFSLRKAISMLLYLSSSPHSKPANPCHNFHHPTQWAYNVAYRWQLQVLLTGTWEWPSSSFSWLHPEGWYREGAITHKVDTSSLPTENNQSSCTMDLILQSF